MDFGILSVAVCGGAALGCIATSFIDGWTIKRLRSRLSDVTKERDQLRTARWDEQVQLANRRAKKSAEIAKGNPTRAANRREKALS